MTVFSNASPMLSDVTDFEFRHRQVHDAALVRIERADLLRQAGVLGLAAEEQRHLPQLFVLALAISHAIHHEPAALGGFVAIHRGHDVLQRGERFALAADQHVAVLAIEVDADAVRHLLGRGLEVEIHCVDDLLHKLGDV